MFVLREIGGLVQKLNKIFKRNKNSGLRFAPLHIITHNFCPLNAALCAFVASFTFKDFYLDTFLLYLPAIVTAVLIAPVGLYVKIRFKSLAVKQDFSDAIIQLEKSTKAVEDIKSQLNEKYWIKQQVWETKRIAYEELNSSLFLTQKYLEKYIDYLSNYAECFIHISYSSDGPYESPHEEEHHRSYQEYIKTEQEDFNKKYESESSKSERQDLENKTKESVSKLESLFSTKSMYFHLDLKEIESGVLKLKHEIFSKDFTHETEEHLSDFFDRMIGHHEKCKESVSDLICIAKKLAIKDLNL